MSTPAITVNGTSGAYEQPQKFGVDSSGPYCLRTWRGTAAEIATQYNSCIASGALAEIEAGFGTHTVRARYAITIGGGTEAPVDSWEFFASHVEKDVLETDLAAIEAISPANREKLKDYVANPPGLGVAAHTAADFLDDGSGSRANAFSLYQLMLSGVKAVRVNAPLLRHTQSVSNVYTVKASLTNVGSILSTSTLATFESIPTSVLFNLPTDVSTRANMNYGWLKLHPTIRTAARQKMQIELEYEYGLWATLLYGSPI